MPECKIKHLCILGPHGAIEMCCYYYYYYYKTEERKVLGELYGENKSCWFAFLEPMIEAVQC